MKKQRIVIIDNYDSFTFNLAHAVESLLDDNCTVLRNDGFSLDDITPFDAVILSPGPGLPEEAGLLLPLIEKFFTSKKILGVCLGHQALAIARGAKLKQLDKVIHGVTRKCSVFNVNALFEKVPSPFDAGRYHSWVIDRITLPAEFIITAVDDEQEIMAMQHHTLPVFGVQFHPESIMTPCGKQILENWLLY